MKNLCKATFFPCNTPGGGVEKILKAFPAFVTHISIFGYNFSGFKIFVTPITINESKQMQKY